VFGIYDITNNKIVISHVVVFFFFFFFFFEYSPGNCNPPSSSPNFLNLTPYYENGESDIDYEIGYHNNNKIYENINNNINNNIK